MDSRAVKAAAREIRRRTSQISGRFRKEIEKTVNNNLALRPRNLTLDLAFTLRVATVTPGESSRSCSAHCRHPVQW